VSVLRQEFVDELIPERSLRDEFLSVFVEERQIKEDLRAVEAELEAITGDEGMQEILDRMQTLQARADAKDVYGLDTRAEKVMNLMGFDATDVEAPVSSFSGGWKMRIGLGKVSKPG
jgi:ATPase subunit of ABC transporter with duplicated ATPase domains